jgi:hypothetical protein
MSRKKDQTPKEKVTQGVNGSADGSSEPPIEIAPINQPSSDLPAIPFQAETLLPANLLPASLPPELESGWVAPIDCGLVERLERAKVLTCWCDGISRLDALVCKRTGESLWHVWDWFRRRKEQIKEEGRKLKDEPLTWTKVLKEQGWDRATVSRRIRFYQKHRNTPDDQLDGATISKMWTEQAEYLKEPPALGEFYRVKRNCREVISDERGKSLSTQIQVDEGTIIEVAAFNDGNHNDTVMRIKAGKHAGKCFTTQGVSLSNPVDPAQVPTLVMANEDARKTKPKKSKSKKPEGVVVGTLPSADAPVWVFQSDDRSVQKVAIKHGRWALLSDLVNLYLKERVRIVTEVNDQTIFQVVMPHGFDFFRVATATVSSLFTKECDLTQGQPPDPAEPPLSEDCKEGIAQVASFLAFLERFKPTLHEYNVLSEKLDEVCSYYDQMREGLTPSE